MIGQVLLCLTIAVLTQLPHSCAVGGYHYERPAAVPVPVIHTGHNFPPLSTVVPLPPVPAIPPLPTARPNAHVQTQSLVQTHPQVPTRSIAAAYRPPSASYPSAPTGSPLSQPYQQPINVNRTPNELLFGQRFGLPPTSAGTTAPTGPAVPQPLRIPFGKQAIIHPPPSAPGNDVYLSNDGRQLKQYAVVEIIDNDIEQNTQPFFTMPFFDSYRAQIGASGTGATPGDTQIQSRAGGLIAEQQVRSGDAVALGSGGLGFIRLANGDVHLGSGSLGYVSGQQRQELIRDARTRTGAPNPSPVHFGHGALGGLVNGLRFK